MDLMATDTSVQHAPIGGGLLTVLYERRSRGRRTQPQRETHAWLAPDMFWLLLPTTVLSESSVGAHK